MCKEGGATHCRVLVATKREGLHTAGCWLLLRGRGYTLQGAGCY